MADINPFDVAPSQLTTNPPVQTSSVYRKRPAALGQLGMATAYVPAGESFSSAIRPHYYQLAAWETSTRKEPIIKDGIDKIILSVTNKIGEYHHVDSEINDFVNANLKNIKRWIAELIRPSYWAGYGVSEIIWQRKEGPNGLPQTWIEDIVSYHPTQVEFRLNLHGRLTHGEKLPTSQFLTGVWVPAPPEGVAIQVQGNNRIGSLIRLPKSKVIHTSMGAERTNPYGCSQLIPVLEYHLFKEAFRDMMAVALDRYGTPLLYAVVPPQTTGQMITDPDGTNRPKSYREVVAEALEDLRSETAIVFEQVNKDHPVTLDTLTTANNFADAFKEAIDMCDHNMMAGMGIPNLIVRDNRSGLGSGQSSENQVQMFHTFISAIFETVVNDFTNQAITQLISYNFDPRKNKKAYDPGQVKQRPFRFADIESLVNSISKLTELGFVNPSNQQDFDHVRDLVQLPMRKVDSVAQGAANAVIEAGRPSPLPQGAMQPAQSDPTDATKKLPFDKKVTTPPPKLPPAPKKEATPSKSSKNATVKVDVNVKGGSSK